MPDDKIDIHIGSTADTKGFDKTQSAAKKLNDAVEAGNAEALVAAFEELAVKAIAVNEAIENGDQEAAKEAYAAIKKEIQELTSEFENLPPEIEEFKDQFDELEKEINDGKQFKKLSDEVKESNKSLSKLERLKVAETFSNLVTQGRQAGTTLAKLGDENQSLAESFLDTAEASTQAVGTIASGFAAGGPIGAALAALSVVIGTFTEQNKQLATSIGKAFGEIDTSFKQSEASIKRGIALAEELEEAFERQNDALKTRQRNHEANLAIQQKEAELQARREDNDFKLRELQISGDLNLTEDDRTKKLASLETEKLKAEFDRKQEKLENRLEETEKQLNDLVESREDANKRVTNARSKLDESLSLGNQDELEEEVENAKIRLNENIKKAVANLQKGIAFGSGFFQDKRGDIKDILGDLKEGKSEDLNKGNSLQENAHVAQRLLDAIDGSKDGLISGTKVSDTKTYLNNIIALAASVKRQEKRNNETIDRQQAFQKELDAAKTNRDTVDKTFDDKAADLFQEKRATKAELAALPGFQKQEQGFINQKQDTELNKSQQRREQQKRQIAAKQKKQKAATDRAANAVINQFLAKAQEVGNTPEVDSANHQRANVGADLDGAELQIFQRFIQSSQSFSSTDQKLKNKLLETLNTVIETQALQIAENKAALEKINAAEQAANSER